jgi:hypothetical protein
MKRRRERRRNQENVAVEETPAEVEGEAEQTSLVRRRKGRRGQIKRRRANQGNTEGKTPVEVRRERAAQREKRKEKMKERRERMKKQREEAGETPENRHEKYKGVHLPRCNDGQGCDVCWEKYYAKHGGKERVERIRARREQKKN